MTERTSRKGATRKRNATVRKAAAKRAAREAKGEPLVQPKSLAQLDAAAADFLAKHQLRAMPATLAMAKLYVQMHDAVDALYDVTVGQQKEQRQISAMVSAAKIAVLALEKLGLPGDDIEEDEAAANLALAEKAKAPSKKSKRPPASPVVVGADKPDDLDAYE